MKKFQSILQVVTVCKNTHKTSVIGEAQPVRFVPYKRELGSGESKHTLHMTLLPPLYVCTCACVCTHVSMHLYTCLCMHMCAAYKCMQVYPCMAARYTHVCVCMYRRVANSCDGGRAGVWLSAVFCAAGSLGAELQTASWPEINMAASLIVLLCVKSRLFCSSLSCRQNSLRGKEGEKL